MTHAILFDLDGTLVDHASAARAALHAWSPTVGVDTDVERWIELDKWGFARFERRNHAFRSAARPHQGVPQQRA